jgi:Putative cyclase
MKNTISYSRVVDLTHTIDPSNPLWPGDPQVVFEVVATMEKDGHYLRSFTIGEHSATHMNAPNSFISGGHRVDHELSGAAAGRSGGRHRHPGIDASHETNTQIAKAHKITIECMANLDLRNGGKPAQHHGLRSVKAPL